MLHSMRHNVLETLLYARRDWDMLIDRIDESIMHQPGVCGDWSIKDIIAHITWYDNEIEELLRTRKLEGSDLWELEPNQRNEAIFKASQLKSLDEIRRESLQVFARLLTAVEDAEPEDFADPGRFENMPQDWQPLEIIAMNTWVHYAHHAEQIEAFIAQW